MEACADDSFGTPMTETSDSTSRSTRSSERDSILRGDFEMSRYRNCPQLTLAIVKPDGMRYIEPIEGIIRQEGFKIVQTRLVHLSPEQASNFYHEHYGLPHFPELISAMSEAPVKVLLLQRKDAVATWKKLCGPASVEEARKMWPDSLRAIFGTPECDQKNVCHASATAEKAAEEIRFFFPSMVLESNIRDEIMMEDYLRDNVNPTLLEGLAQVCKYKPIDPVLWLAEWLLTNNPYKPKMDKRIALTPT